MLATIPESREPPYEQNYLFFDKVDNYVSCLYPSRALVHVECEFYRNEPRLECALRERGKYLEQCAPSHPAHDGQESIALLLAGARVQERLQRAPTQSG
jgi:hypothetical protein